MIVIQALAKIWPFGRKIQFHEEGTTSKWPIFVCTKLDYLTLEGSGRQTFDTRSSSVKPLKSYGYDGSNGLCGRSVASKYFCSPSVRGNWWKSEFFFETLRTLFYFSSEWSVTNKTWSYQIGVHIQFYPQTSRTKNKILFCFVFFLHRKLVETNLETMVYFGQP